MKLCRDKRTHAFSLIELMVVISITSVLVTMGVSSMLRLKFKAMQSEAKNHSHFPLAAMTSYVAQTDNNVEDFTTACANGYDTGSGSNSCAVSRFGYDPINCNHRNPFGFTIAN